MTSVTLVSHSFPPVPGGGETIIYSIAKFLSRKKYKVTVITGDHGIKFGNTDHLYNGFEVIKLPGLFEYSYGTTGIKDILDPFLEAIVKIKPDVVHSFDFFPGYLSSMYCKYTNTQHVFTFFKTPMADGRIMKLSETVLHDKIVGQKIFRDIDPDIILNISRCYEDSISQLNTPKEKIRFCYPGADKDIFSSSKKSSRFRESYGVKDDEFLIIIPARIVPRKNIEIAIESLHIINNPKVKLIISSGGMVQTGYEEYYQKIFNMIVEYRLQNSIILPTEKFNIEELGELYASSDLCLLTSIEEGLGMGLLEMIESGVPIVTSNSCGAREIIKDHSTGWLFEIGNVTQLTQILSHVINNPTERLMIAKNAQLFTHKHFDLNHYIEFHSKLYKSLLK